VAYSDAAFNYLDYITFESPEVFNKYIDTCRSLQLYDTGVRANFGDKLITLSTCEYSRKDGRMVVVARKLNG
jgi:sortase B